MEELNKLDQHKKGMEEDLKKSTENYEKIKVGMEKNLENLEKLKKELKEMDSEYKNSQKMAKKAKSAEESAQKKYESEVKSRDELAQKINGLDQNADPVFVKKEKEKLVSKLNKAKEKEDELKIKYDQCVKTCIDLENDFSKIDARYIEKKTEITKTESNYVLLEKGFKESLTKIEDLKVKIFDAEKKYKEEFDKLMKDDNLELTIG